MLHGFLGDHRAFAKGYGGFDLAAAMNDLIRKGAAREMIVVVPSGRNGYFGSFYTNSPGGYGALMLAMKHADVFGAVYALSPCCVGIEGDMGPDNPAWAAAASVQSRDELQAVIASLPLADWIGVEITELAEHPITKALRERPEAG